MSINEEPRRMMVLPLGSCSFVPLTVRGGSPPPPPASAPPPAAPEEPPVLVAPPAPVVPPAPAAAADPPAPPAPDVPALFAEHAGDATAPPARIQSSAAPSIFIIAEYIHMRRGPVSPRLDDASPTERGRDDDPSLRREPGVG